MRNFVGVDLSSEDVPDATTLLKFRRLLETQKLTEAIFEEVGRYLEDKKLRMKEGTIVDCDDHRGAEFDQERERAKRDPEMPQTRKGNQWYFGKKAHIGVDAKSGLVHRVTATAANLSDLSQAGHLLHGREKTVHADAGYQEVEKHVSAEVAARVGRLVAVKRGRIKALAEGLRKQVWTELERRKAQVGSLIEHPFDILKNLFGYRKVRYRGPAKNLAQLHSLFALANLFIARPFRSAQLSLPPRPN